jgi:type 1 glutamine amidotransferase
MKISIILYSLIALAILVPAVAQQAAPPAAPAMSGPSADVPPLRVYLRGGLKTHGEGQHDYPQFVADWSKILTERGAIVDGSLHFPTAQEIEGVDVIVQYKGDAGYMTLAEKATLETFLKRGGGLVGIHDTICTDDPEWFSTIYGGAKKHGEVNFTLDADVPYTIVDTASPIMQGIPNFSIKDESFYLMTWSKQPEVHVLATAKIDATPSAVKAGHAGESVPQMWTYQRTIFGGQEFRAFVWMQGHTYSNLTHPNVQPMLLRAIAWAGKRPIDSLMTITVRRGGFPGGGRGTPPGGAPKAKPPAGI